MPRPRSRCSPGWRPSPPFSSSARVELCEGGRRPLDPRVVQRPRRDPPHGLGERHVSRAVEVVDAAEQRLVGLDQSLQVRHGHGRAVTIEQSGVVVVGDERRGARLPGQRTDGIAVWTVDPAGTELERRAQRPVGHEAAADVRLGLDDGHLGTAVLQRPRRRQPGNSGADDDDTGARDASVRARRRRPDQARPPQRQQRGNGAEAQDGTAVKHSLRHCIAIRWRGNRGHLSTARSAKGLTAPRCQGRAPGRGLAALENGPAPAARCASDVLRLRFDPRGIEKERDDLLIGSRTDVYGAMDTVVRRVPIRHSWMHMMETCRARDARRRRVPMTRIMDIMVIPIAVGIGCGVRGSSWLTVC